MERCFMKIAFLLIMLYGISSQAYVLKNISWNWMESTPKVANLWINPNCADTSAPNELIAIINAYSTWSAVETNFEFDYGGVSYVTNWDSNGHNDVCWYAGICLEDPRTTAETNIWWDGSNIIETDIIFYDSLWIWSTSSIPGRDQMDVISVALHELGHCLGLGHSAVESAVMYENLDPEEVKRNLDNDDENGMEAIYGLIVDDPNGSEIWYIDTSYDINWVHDSPDQYIDILINRYYPSSGTWVPIYSHIINDGTQSWTPTDPPSSTCRIRVRSYDNPSFVYDVSDANFTVGGYQITNPTAPGITWHAGDYEYITWLTAGNIGNVNIKINTDYPNGDWDTVDVGISDNGSYYWLVEEYNSLNCRIKVENTTTPSHYDISKNNFAIRTVDGLNEKFLSEINPNPFNSSTRIHYQIPNASKVTLTVYNVTGRKVAVLENRNMDPGEHETFWDASSMPSGIYFLHIYTEEFQDTKKLLLLK